MTTPTDVLEVRELSVRIARTGEAGDQHAHAGEQRVDEDDDHDDELPRDADRGVAGVAHQVAHEDVIHDPLETADDVGEHRGPGELPDRGAERPFHEAAVIAGRGGGDTGLRAETA